MRNFKYYTALMLELVGIAIICFGLAEMIVMDMLNPANFLITAGSAIVATGSLIFAKIVDWGKFVNNCESCYKDK